MIKGTLVNTLCVLLGSFIGVNFKNIISDKIHRAILNSIGIITLVIGIKNSLLSDDIINIIISIILGVLIGEKIDVENYIHIFSNKIKKIVKNKNTNFTEGLLTAFLIFCVGSMTILGSFQEGIYNDPTMLYIKSTLDFITSATLAASLGWGVLFSALPLFLFQTILTITAHYSGSFLTTDNINAISSIGGIILIALGLNILQIKKIKTANMLPALFLYPIIKIIIDLFNQ